MRSAPSGARRCPDEHDAVLRDLIRVPPRTTCVLLQERSAFDVPVGQEVGAVVCRRAPAADRARSQHEEPRRIKPLPEEVDALPGRAGVRGCLDRTREIEDRIEWFARALPIGERAGYYADVGVGNCRGWLESRDLQPQRGQP